MDFQDLLAKNGSFGGQNNGKGGAMLTPQQTRSYFWGLLPLCHFCENRSRNATVRVRTDRQTDTRSDSDKVNL